MLHAWLADYARHLTLGCTVMAVPARVLQAELCFDSFAYYQSVMDFAGYHSINPDISKVS